MGKSTGIEWTDSTWNPIRGCSRVSEGCRNCYAESVAARFSGLGQAYFGLASFKIIGEGTPSEHVEPHWTGDVRLIEKHLDDPLHWKEPRKIFVNSMSDLFHTRVKDEWLASIFDVMARAPQHTYQILTKRPERMRDALLAGSAPDVACAFENTYRQEWPPKNWLFGVSVEDQETVSHRLKFFEGLDCFPLFISYEPALGPINWFETDFADLVDWIICGGESGPHARPIHPEWARSTRDFCKFHGIPFFFKQWGAWIPGAANGFTQWPEIDNSRPILMPEHPGRAGRDLHQVMLRVGKHNSGALLDGVEYKEFPNVDALAHA